MRIATALILTAGLLAPASAQAEDEEGSDYHFGIGLGFGEMSADCEGCDSALEAASVDVTVGYLIDDDMSVVVDAWALYHPGDEVTVSNTMLFVGLQYWPYEDTWVRAGAGWGVLAAELDDGEIDETESSAALLLALGYALAETDMGLLDVQLRMGTVFYEELDTSIYNGSLSLGLSWQ